MRLLGGTAAVGIAAQLEWLDTVSAVAGAQAPTGGAKIPVPAGGVIRTITGDIDPNSLSGGTLMHEHLGNGRAPQAGERHRPWTTRRRTRRGWPRN